VKRLKKLIALFGVIPVVAFSAPVEPVNIQSTGTATAATKMRRDTYYLVQCSEAAYVLWGGPTVAVSKTRGNASFGEPMAKSEKVITKSGVSDGYIYVSVISDTGTADCTFWPEVP
jgi:hypothetical protein